MERFCQKNESSRARLEPRWRGESKSRDPYPTTDSSAHRGPSTPREVSQANLLAPLRMTRGRGFCIAGLKACSTLTLFTVLLALAGCRQDMHDQPRFKPFARSDFYTDLRSARPPVEGTVARGELREDAYLYTGKIGSNPGDYMPFPVTAEVLAARTAALRHLLRALPLPRGRWQRRDSVAWFPAQAAFLSHRAPAQGAPGIFFRRDHQRLRRHARLRIADCRLGTAGPSWPTSAPCS